MWVRRAFFWWLLPAALLLPLWLFVGWGVFSAGAWAFLWVLFIAIPSVFVGQLVMTLLTRSRPSVRAQRAVSWWDVLGYGVWHALTIALGFFAASWWAPVMVLTVLVGIALVWLQLWQGWREAREGRIVLHATDGTAYLSASGPASRPADAEREVFVVEETPPADR